MRVLHITNEFTKKNYSIASLIIFISNYLHKNFNINFSLLACNANKYLFNDANIITDSKFNKWSNFFVINRGLKKIIHDYDLIHIHGIWAPIQLFSILKCNRESLNCVIHPHGMLLPEALGSGGTLKYFFKLISLYILKVLLNKNISFISITNQETEAIKKFFPEAKIDKISNPIPFEISEIKEKILKKRFVYFGRIHPHKNLDILIKAFLESKLNEEWKLEIYGIRDDENYYEKLLKLIGNNQQVKIKEPIFDKDKQKIMQQSWANVLISKSEVVSLSILESSAYKLPSLINQNIEITGLETSVIPTSLSFEEIKKNIINISKWSNSERVSIGEKLSENSNQESSINFIGQKYNYFYESINTDILTEYKKPIFFSDLFTSKNINFFMVSLTYMFNLMFPSLLVIMFVVMGKYSIAGELGLLSSFWITVTQIFSSNMRSIVISEQRTDYAIMTVYYRFVFSLISFFIFYLFVDKFIQLENISLIYLMSLLILSQWINEMNLVQSEIKNKNTKFKFIIFINLLTTILSLFLIYFSEYKLLSYVIFIYIIYIFVDSLLNFSKSNIVKNNIISYIFKLNIQTLAFLSSFSIIISSFAWKLMIYYIFNKSLAGIFFACFSVGSFPGTLFNSVIGPAFIKKKMKIPKLFKIIFFIFFLILMFSLFLTSSYLYKQNNIDFFGREFFYFTIVVSLIGSYLMSYAMYLRHKQIQISIIERSNLFKTDIFYGISITFIIPILYKIGGEISVSFSYFVGSFVALVLYSIREKNIKFYKNLN